MSVIAGASRRNVFVVGDQISLNADEEAKVNGLTLAYAGDVANNAGFTLMRISGKLKLADLIGQIVDEGLQIDFGLPHAKEVMIAADASVERQYSLVLVSNDEIDSNAPVFEPIPTVIAVQMVAARILAKQEGAYPSGTFCQETISDESLRVVVASNGNKIALTAGVVTSDSQVSTGKMIRIS